MTRFLPSVEISDGGMTGVMTVFSWECGRAVAPFDDCRFHVKTPSPVACEMLREEGRSLIRSELSQGPRLSN